MQRSVEPEWLDDLSANDPRAIRSRRDLRRVNVLMRNHASMAAGLRAGFNGIPPRDILELGAGDGDFFLRVAKQLSSSWPGASVRLLDRQPVATPATLNEFKKLGWRAESVVLDVFDWTCDASAATADIVVANLFLHHLAAAQLVELFRAISVRTRLFVALEPRRAVWPLFCSRLLWAVGCNAITRHDAVISVRAGFAGNELSALWPAGDEWRLTERPAGLFSHLFIARLR